MGCTGNGELCELARGRVTFLSPKREGPRNAAPDFWRQTPALNFPGYDLTHAAKTFPSPDDAVLRGPVNGPCVEAVDLSCAALVPLDFREKIFSRCLKRPVVGHLRRGRTTL
jgi:hypothetical protein